jgi:lipopolysaccharide biosynthesis glycosyltransferase
MFANQRTALCLTPDRAFFPQAVCAASTVLSHHDADQFDLRIVCEEEDVAPGFERLPSQLRGRISLDIVDFKGFDRGLGAHGRFSRAVFRRLFLDRVLPEVYQRIISLDSDVWVARPGLGKLTTFDFGGAPFAAAYDMIFLMDFNPGPLARSFQAQRAALGLGRDTPYFNAGLMAIDRRRWTAMSLGERAIRAISQAPERYPFREQSALNELIAGAFAPLSPRYNFMGDFFLLGLETEIAPIVLHFVNAPKPWDFEDWRGERRFAEAYRNWLAASPWPELAAHASPTVSSRAPRLTPKRRAFAARLMAFLRRCDFVDGWPWRATQPESGTLGR